MFLELHAAAGRQSVLSIIVSQLLLNREYLRIVTVIVEHSFLELQPVAFGQVPQQEANNQVFTRRFHLGSQRASLITVNGAGNIST